MIHTEMRKLAGHRFIIQASNHLLPPPSRVRIPVGQSLGCTERVPRAVLPLPIPIRTGAVDEQPFAPLTPPPRRRRRPHHPARCRPNSLLRRGRLDVRRPQQMSKGPMYVEAKPMLALECASP